MKTLEFRKKIESEIKQSIGRFGLDADTMEELEKNIIFYNCWNSDNCAKYFYDKYKICVFVELIDYTDKENYTLKVDYDIDNEIYSFEY